MVEEVFRCGVYVQRWSWVTFIVKGRLNASGYIFNLIADGERLIGDEFICQQDAGFHLGFLFGGGRTP